MRHPWSSSERPILTIYPEAAAEQYEEANRNSRLATRKQILIDQKLRNGAPFTSNTESRTSAT